MGVGCVTQAWEPDRNTAAAILTVYVVFMGSVSATPYPGLRYGEERDGKE